VAVCSVAAFLICGSAVLRVYSLFVCSLLVAHCSRAGYLVARCSLLAARCSLLAARCSLLDARCSMLVALCSQIVTRCSLPVCRLLGRLSLVCSFAPLSLFYPFTLHVLSARLLVYLFARLLLFWIIVSFPQFSAPGRQDGSRFVNGSAAPTLCGAKGPHGGPTTSIRVSHTRLHLRHPSQLWLRRAAKTFIPPARFVDPADLAVRRGVSSGARSSRERARHADSIRYNPIRPGAMRTSRHIMQRRGRLHAADTPHTTT
jgi:hypothetical protein